MTEASAVVVARTSATAKSRLGAVLQPAQRATLARAMLADVLDACQRAPLSRCVVVVDDAAGLALAENVGARAVLDAGGDMNAAVRAGLDAVAAFQPAVVVVLPGDIPLVSPDDLARLIQAVLPCQVVVGRDRGGSGTNALVLRPPGVLAPAFGPASAQRHVALARTSGLRAHVLDLPGLGLDVDTPQDLMLLAQRQPGGRTGEALAGLTLSSAVTNCAETPVR